MDEYVGIPLESALVVFPFVGDFLFVLLCAPEPLKQVVVPAECALYLVQIPLQVQVVGVVVPAPPSGPSFQKVRVLQVFPKCADPAGEIAATVSGVGPEVFFCIDSGPIH